MAPAPEKATQHMLRYLFTLSANPNGDLTQNKLKADAAPGPLKAKLSRSYTGPEWENLLSDPDLSITVVPYNQGTSTFNASYAYRSMQNRIELTVAGQRTVVVEIRFNHSIDK